MKNTISNHESSDDSNATELAQSCIGKDSIIVEDHNLHRALDIGVAAIMLGIASPLILARTSLNLLKGERMAEGSPAVGLAMKPFRLLSIVHGNRCNRIAQLFNVLRGDLSLVGPRPLSSAEAKLVPEQYRVRFMVRPGLFSPHMLKKSTGIDYCGEWSSDCDYVDKRSLKIYVGTILRSLVAGALGTNNEQDNQDDLKIFGVKITNTTMEEAVEWIIDRGRGVDPVNVGFINADCLNKVYRNDDYYSTLGRFDRILADGIGVRIAANLQKSALQANVNGTDMFPRLCERLADTDLSIFLLGARPDVAEFAASSMKQHYPNLNIAGTHHGYFEPGEEEDEVITQINSSGASVLLVALGSPSQELWIGRNKYRLAPRVRIGVGGLFDFYSGRISRAPMWVREVGMEWVWRLLQEPGRMWRRYIIGNPLFLLRVWFDYKRSQKLGTADSGRKRSILDHFQRLNHGVRVFRMRARLMRWFWSAGVHAPRMIKRLFDVAGSGLMLVLLSPLFALVALVIKIDSSGSILFSQTRIGKYGKPFRFWKFRSMYQDSEQRKVELEAENEMQNGVLFKMKRDPRVTPLGRLLRKYSIDELPQLWNVFKGEMSFVGPRPCLPNEVAQYSLYELKRLEAVPGLTCYWQISGRSELSFQEQVELDLKYLYSRGLFEDIKILFKTIPAVVTGNGAY